MIQKIQERLNKEIEKVIAKEELTHADYYFLDKNLEVLKEEQKLKESNNMIFDCLEKIAETFSFGGYKNV